MDSHQINLYTAILISSFVIGSIIIYFVISVVRQQRKTLKLQRLNILAEINAIEKEQTRIARDLHDQIGPILNVAKYQVDAVEASNPEDQVLLEKASKNLNDSINQVREISRNLIPSSLERKGLKTALTEIAEETNEYTPLHVQLEYEVESVIGEDIGIHIYRMIRELVQNAIKYAEAELMFIRIREENSMLSIFAEDNGKGFDYHQKMAEQPGLGLRNLKARVDIMRGQLRVNSVLGKGTQFIILIPVQQ